MKWGGVLSHPTPALGALAHVSVLSSCSSSGGGGSHSPSSHSGASAAVASASCENKIKLSRYGKSGGATFRERRKQMTRFALSFAFARREKTKKKKDAPSEMHMGKNWKCEIWENMGF